MRSLITQLQGLFVYLVVECDALHNHQPNQAGYLGAGYTSYADSSVAASYGGYEAYASFHTEKGDSDNAKTGSYDYKDANGLFRRVNYVTDAYGFRVTVDTNEPGTVPGASAGAVFNAAPVVPLVPSSSGQSQAPAPYGTQPAAEYLAGGYGGYSGYRYNLYAGAA
ncbi:hypothetical protein HPB51_027736 [Rhipicephalus microplus]|uniref:Cuticle protein n=1 Tax=Rhipicephalus microplus TaxID=6941 RepID=A0A9J6CZH2_RHIMP|nr:hypothetical protein HPB51_027736 [Rhipicephalus microplus]